jgi:hypothetical protein
MKLVLVEWIDIISEGGWRSASKLDNFITDEGDHLVLQVGFLYEEDENQIVLLDSYFPHRELYGGVHKIPKGCVVSITHIPYILPEKEQLND